jgi:transposase, IS30 family
MAQLTDHQIHSIEDKIKEGLTDAKIAQYIHRDRSVVSRLLKKYPRETFDADAVIADRLRTKGDATKQHTRIEPWGTLSLYIREKFLLNWSPEQITGSWKKKQKKELFVSVKLSKDTVYDWIYLNYTPKELKKHLRRKNKEYRDRKKEAALGWKYQMWDQIKIDERAKKYPEVWKRDEEWYRIEEIGHWEWDTIIWKNRSGAILTLVERRTGKSSSENSHSERMQYDSPQYSRDSCLIYPETRSKVLPSTMDESSQITGWCNTNSRLNMA